MSATSVLRPATFARPRLTVRGPVRDLVRGFLQRLVALDARYRARTTLLVLDDRILRDIGLTRADVAAELRRPLS